MRRRTLLLGAAAFAPGAALAAAAGDDGLFHEPWFVESFLDLADDHAAARQAGRHLAVLWELRGCPLCRRLHEVTLSDPVVVAAMRARLDVVLLDIIGARPVTPAGGAPVAEKELARAWQVLGTPTLMLPPGTAAGSRLEGFVPPAAMLSWLAALPAVAA